MNPGEYKHKITIQQATSTVNDLGNQIQTWANFATVWAKIKTKSNQEKPVAAQEESEEIIELETRQYISGINTLMRVILGSDVLELLAAIDPDRRKIRLVLTCKKSSV